MILPSAVFFQLIWLDLFYVGTYVPPQGLIAYLAFLPPALCFNLQSPREALLLLIFCLPLARVAAQLETTQRGSQGDKNYLKLLETINAGGDIAGTLRRVIRAELWRRALAAATLCAGGAALLLALVWLLGVQFESWPVAETLNLPLGDWFGLENGAGRDGGWGLLWAFAAVGGFLSLRIRSAFVCFLAGAAALGVLFFVLG
ncbi:MAG: hypothetical protein LBM64_09825 [Deltaproteobacteria bacterium]|nr:hypothetical protein [Deltaproteobacteria bacterium]